MGYEIWLERTRAGVPKRNTVRHLFEPNIAPSFLALSFLLEREWVYRNL